MSENKKMRPDFVVIHYGEIAIKGKNRGSFEKLLIRNIKEKLKGASSAFRRESGQISMELAETADIETVRDTMKCIPGIAYFSFVKRCSNDPEVLKATVLEYVQDIEYTTFRINAKRRFKSYPVKSMDLNVMLGSAVVEKYNKKVQMKGADLNVKVEIAKDWGYISLEDIRGAGGMPTDNRQKMVGLLSGGFDSPVASYMMMKRGCKVIMVHFRNKLQEGECVDDKIRQLAEQLSKFQTETLLYVVPFEDIQKNIIMNVHSGSRMLIYRRFMIKIASKIADRHGAKFLITGDNLSQVASQTFDNLLATYEDTPKHIFTPLIGMDKQEIIDISKKIGTYEISAMPYGDCCSYFVPPHPELRAKANDLQDMEGRFDAEALMDASIEDLEPIRCGLSEES